MSDFSIFFYSNKLIKEISASDTFWTFLAKIEIELVVFIK